MLNLSAIASYKQLYSCTPTDNLRGIIELSEVVTNPVGCRVSK